jgi:uncharacterized protein
MNLYVFSLLLFLGGAAGGAINSVAGGGSFILFPAMIFGGIPPVAANATTATALWPAGLASLLPYWSHLPRERRTLILFAIMSALGGGIGAALLLITSDRTFARVFPFLMLAAALVFTFGPRLTRRTRPSPLDPATSSSTSSTTRRSLLVAASIQFLISIYGGYFGGGMGIVMLATFTLMGMTDMHEMNALKVVLALLINGVALVTFILAGKVVMSAAIPAAIGSVVGGWSGAALARRLAPKYVRRFVLVIAWSMTAWFMYSL